MRPTRDEYRPYGHPAGLPWPPRRKYDAGHPGRSNRPSFVAFNEDWARQDFGHEYFAQLKSWQPEFRGDWWQLAFLSRCARESYRDDTRGSFLDWNDSVTALNVPQHLEGARLRHVQLTGADLTNTYLIGADLDDAKLIDVGIVASHFEDASLRGAVLDGCRFWSSHVERACFDRASLGYVIFDSCVLNQASFIDCDLGNASFINSSMTGCDFTNAVAGQTIFSEVDLSTIAGLDALRHSGPSSIGVESLVRSASGISDNFLRGCGLPEEVITHLPSIVASMRPIEFYSCFVSYSHHDEAFARRLHSRLRDEKLRVWVAAEDMRSGQRLYDQIDQAIRVHDRLLLVLSEWSMSSEWVKTEIRRARRREREEGRQVVFPIRLTPMAVLRDWVAFDADTGKDMAAEIREYHIPDFSGWKDEDLFETAFIRLMRDLQKSASSQS